MMPIDQAEGLRRMRGQQRRHAVVIAAPRAIGTRSVAALGLATRFSLSGRRVLLVEENRGPGNALYALGLSARYDLVHVLTREKRLDDIVVHGPHGLTLISAARVRRVPLQCASSAAAALAESMREMSIPPDTLVIAAAAGTTGITADVLCERFGHRELVLLVGSGVDSIVGAYALLKRAARECRDQVFGLLVTGVADAAGASAIHRNMDQAALRFLGTKVAFLGQLAAGAAAAR
jgi:flagellar biosynthesis protein FlhG